ncbi:MAG: 3,4-dihydroxy-2-butanone-4-phosphate synthase, partial [Pseudodesulfovibrio sp.]
SRYQTAFTVSIEAAEGVTTGVSAADRLATVRAATAPGAKPGDVASPGHVFPLRARSGGVLERGGHTEATVDMARLAGFAPCGVLCELTNPDGTMARLPEIVAFAERHGFPVLTVADIAAYRLRAESAAA